MTGFVADPEIHGHIPVVELKNRPLWTVVIPTHNCAKYLRVALESVLRQDAGEDNMEIIVVDDCSTLDDPEAVVREVAGDRVRFIRQKENVGKARNYETGIAASTGQLIHQLHGDDCVLPGFYESTGRCFRDFPKARAVFCESNYIDQDGTVVGTTGKERSASGLLDEWLPTLVKSQRIQTPSIVVRREVYENLGAFDRRLSCFEDWEMWIRVATTYRFAFNTEATAQYRVYSENTSSQSVISGKRTRVLNQMLTIVDGYLPPDVLQNCRRGRSRELAAYLVRCLPIAVLRRSAFGWARLCWNIIRFDRSPRTLYYMLHFTLHHKRYC